LTCSLCDFTSLVRRNHPAAARHPSTGGELKSPLTPFPSFGGVPPAGGGVVLFPTAQFGFIYFFTLFAFIRNNIIFRLDIVPICGIMISAQSLYGV